MCRKSLLRKQRSRWDSNPQVLSDAGFRDRCNTNYATAPSVEPAFSNSGGAALGIPPAPGFDLRSPSAILGRLGGWLLDRNADHSFPPRPNLRFWRPPSAAAACSLTRACKSRRELVCSSIRVGAPGFEPGTSASRTQRSTELSHAPNSSGWGGIDLRSPSAILGSSRRSPPRTVPRITLRRLS